MKVTKDSSTFVLWFSLGWYLIQLLFWLGVFYILATAAGELLVKLAETV